MKSSRVRRSREPLDWTLIGHSLNFVWISRCPETLGLGKNVAVCASVRVWPLPGGLLPSQPQEVEYGFAGFIPTNKQTKKRDNQDSASLNPLSSRVLKKAVPGCCWQHRVSILTRDFFKVPVMTNWKHSCHSSVISMRSYPNPQYAPLQCGQQTYSGPTQGSSSEWLFR
jgi:hypothetical protein